MVEGDITIFEEQFEKDLRELHTMAAESIGAAFSLTYEPFAARLRRIVDHEYIKKEHGDVKDESRVRKFLASLKAADIYVTVACDSGDERAWEFFFQTYRKFVERTAGQFCRNDAEAEEIAGAILSELCIPMDSAELVEPEGSVEVGSRHTRIGRYSGLGSLKGWLSVLIHNRAVDRHRKTATTTSIDDETASKDWIEQTKVEHDPTVDLDEAKYRAVSNRALSAALDELETRERLLLVYYYRDNLTLKEIGSMPGFGVHEATVSRWLEKVHQKLRRSFERRLTRDERLRQSEIRVCRDLVMRQGIIEIERFFPDSS